MTQQLAKFFLNQVLKSGFLDERIERVEIEYDDNGRKVAIEATTSDGTRVRRIKLRNEIIRGVYYYGDESDVVRKDKSTSNGTLKSVSQRKNGRRKATQLKYNKRVELWRYRDGTDKSSEQLVSLHTDSVTFETLVGPKIGKNDDTTSMLAQFARDVALEADDVARKERTIVFEKVSGNGVSIGIDKKKRVVFLDL